jgi:antirestriction protein
MTDRQICLGTYGDYNDGILGKWYPANNQGEVLYAFAKAVKESGERDNGDEPMIQDSEGFEGFIEESSCQDEINSFLDLAEEDEFEAFITWHQNYINVGKLAEYWDEFKDRFQGFHNSKEDYAWEMIDSMGGVPDYLQYYIDIEKFIQDLEIQDVHMDEMDDGTISVVSQG